MRIAITVGQKESGEWVLLETPDVPFGIQRERIVTAKKPREGFKTEAFLAADAVKFVGSPVRPNPPKPAAPAPVVPKKPAKG
jgi:hypothetical protein